MYGKRPSLEQAQAAQVPELTDRGYPEQAELFAIVQRALQKDRTQRFESAREMLHALEDYARRTHLTASPLRFGEWLVGHFGAQILDFRKTRERAARALEIGPAIELKTLSTPEPPPVELSETDLPVPAPRSDALAAPAPDAGASRAPLKPAEKPQAPAAIWLVIALTVAVVALAAYLLR
jgi:hypothetical protein